MGVVLYVMTTGTLPFQAKALPNLFSIIREGTYKSLPRSLSPSLKDLLSKILVTDPSKRITLREIQKHDWML
jgi:serine/threonine protein kinase